MFLNISFPVFLLGFLYFISTLGPSHAWYKSHFTVDSPVSTLSKSEYNIICESTLQYIILYYLTFSYLENVVIPKPFHQKTILNIGDFGHG